MPFSSDEYLPPTPTKISKICQSERGKSVLSGPLRTSTPIASRKRAPSTCAGICSNDSTLSDASINTSIPIIAASRKPSLTKHHGRSSAGSSANSRSIDDASVSHHSCSFNRSKVNFLCFQYTDTVMCYVYVLAS